MSLAFYAREIFLPVTDTACLSMVLVYVHLWTTHHSARFCSSKALTFSQGEQEGHNWKHKEGTKGKRWQWLAIYIFFFHTLCSSWQFNMARKEIEYCLVGGTGPVYLKLYVMWSTKTRKKKHNFSLYLRTVFFNLPSSWFFCWLTKKKKKIGETMYIYISSFSEFHGVILMLFHSTAG